MCILFDGFDCVHSDRINGLLHECRRTFVGSAAQSIILHSRSFAQPTVRHLVIPDDWKIDLEVRSRSGNYQLTLDGRTMVLEQDKKIRISKAEYKIRVAKQLNHTFFDSLKSKLMWGLDKRN